MESAEALLALGCNAAAAAYLGTTALMLAVAQGKTVLVPLVLAAGAQLETRDGLGLTALLWACAAGQVECVEALLAAGSDVLAVSRNGQTALMVAASGHVHDTDTTQLLPLLAAAEEEAQQRRLQAEKEAQQRQRAAHEEAGRAARRAEAELMAILEGEAAGPCEQAHVPTAASEKKRAKRERQRQRQRSQAVAQQPAGAMTVPDSETEPEPLPEDPAKPEPEPEPQAEAAAVDWSTPASVSTLDIMLMPEARAAQHSASSSFVTLRFPASQHLLARLPQKSHTRLLLAARVFCKPAYFSFSFGLRASAGRYARSAGRRR